jgi:hypothetical protein
VALALQSTRYQFASTPPVTGGVSTAPTTVLYPENSPMRVSLAVGITGHLDEAGDDEHAMKATPPARVFLGVARALPLFRYRVDTAIAGKSRDGRRFEGPPARADGGTVDATSIVSQVPAFSVDVGIGGHISVGAAGSVGVVRFTQDSTRLIPPSSATSIVAWTLSPRIGWRAELSRSFALWPRIGLTYANASAGDTLAYSLAVDAEAFAVFSPVHGVGLVFGPSLGLPVVGARTLDPNDPAARRQEQAVFSVGLTGGLVVEVP